jgi:hypothetical protein
MEIFFVLALFGTVTALLAHSKNRNPVGWFAIGFLFPLFGIILSIVLPPNPSLVDPERSRL